MHILTFDVEDWFHTFKTRYYNKPGYWKNLPSAMERNIEEICGFLSENDIKATFFWLGWSAKRHPKWVQRMAEQGHDIGVHSHLHRKISDMDAATFRSDTKEALKILEDITGKPVTSYRSPGFSINHKTLWAFEILSELGIEKDSSFRTRSHRYPFLSQVPARPFLINGKHFKIKEFPVVGIPVFGAFFNYSGSGYFRISPIRWLQKSMSQSAYAVYYFHPRDFDNGMFKKPDKRWFFRWRYSVGARKTLQKLAVLNQKGGFINMDTAATQIQWDDQPHFAI